MGEVGGDDVRAPADRLDLCGHLFELGLRARRDDHVRTRLSKRGNARLRCALYLPALSAIRFNPSIKAFYERLLENGKCKMAALGAAMRKLLMIAYGVLKNRQSFLFKAAENAA